MDFSDRVSPHDTLSLPFFFCVCAILMQLYYYSNLLSSNDYLYLSHNGAFQADSIILKSNFVIINQLKRYNYIANSFKV